MQPITIYYDGDCPFCARYVRYTRLTEAAGKPKLVDVRRDRESREALERAGYDLDKGMVVEIGDQRFFGAEAMNALALLTTPSGAFNRITSFLFSRRSTAAALYPLLRACRNLVVDVLGRGPLEPRPEDSRVVLFSACWGIFACFHFLAYAFEYYAEAYVTTYLIPALGALAALRPRLRIAFLLLLCVMAVDAWLHMPVFSNHTIMKNFFLAAALAGGVVSALRAEGWSSWFEQIAPIGRALLLVMYVFGVFHKLNTDFLNPDVSCANVLWSEMPWPLSALNAPWWGYVTVYGTLVIETVILVFLLVPRLRHLGIVSGIAFHMMLALSGYALYSAFSSLAMALHVLFLSPVAAERIVASPSWTRAERFIGTFGGRAVIGAYGTALMLAGFITAYPVVALAWFALGVPLLALIVRYGKDETDRRVAGIFVSRRAWLNVVSVLFFFNCITPYLGLKTAQSINMFANLRLEGGVSNHIVLPNAPGPFRYLEDLVEIRASSGAPYLNYVRKEGLRLTYYDLLNQLERTPGAKVTFERGGHVHVDQSAATLRDDIDAILHPRWVRKWFHFTPVDIETPKACARNR